MHLWQIQANYEEAETGQQLSSGPDAEQNLKLSMRSFHNREGKLAKGARRVQIATLSHERIVAKQIWKGVIVYWKRMRLWGIIRAVTNSLAAG